MSNRPTISRKPAGASNVTNLADRRRTTSVRSTQLAPTRIPRQKAKVTARGGVMRLWAGMKAVWLQFMAGQSLIFYMIAVSAGILALFGVVMVLSASSIQSIKDTGNPFSYAWRQGLFFAIGTIFLIIASLLPVGIYQRFAKAFFAIAMFLQLIAATVGTNINGNREWISLGPFTIQPGEFLKLAVILTMALHFQNRQGYEQHGWHYAWSSLIWMGVAAAGIMAGSDMGTTMVIGIVALTMVWLADTPGIFMRAPVTLAAIAVGVGLFGSASRIARINTWLDTSYNDQATSLSWQSVHGVWALANSGIIGRGIGMSDLKWSWIPEVQNDYIFAIIGEELGIAGALLTLLMFGFLGYLIIQVGLRSSDLFGRIVCFGIATWFLAQSLINISVVVMLLPVLGVPLPLISYGGSSLITGMAAIGVVLAIERRNHQQLDGGHLRAPRPRR